MAKEKNGQIAILLMLLIAGLVLMLSLNVEVFKAAREKLRLQNAADASALALARWQGITLNLIGDLNLAHIKAINDTAPADEYSTNFIAGITALQRHIASIGPLIGFKVANDLARDNGMVPSLSMATATELIARSTDVNYYNLVKRILSNGVCAGIDNVKVPNDMILQKDFYDAISRRDFRAICVRFGNGQHSLPPAPTKVPSLEEIVSSGCFGAVGVKQRQIYNLPGLHYDLAETAHKYTSNLVTPENIRTNLDLVISADPRLGWSTYDEDEWENGLPPNLRPGRFPWLNGMNVKHEHAVMGGSATIRVEWNVVSSWNDLHNVDSIRELGKANITSNTSVNTIIAEAGAKVFAEGQGQNVLESIISPPFILPTFTSVRLVPYDFAANNRYDTASGKHIASFPRDDGAQLSRYQTLLDLYHSEPFQKQADQWYSTHEHDVSCAPRTSKGSKTGGGTRRGN